MAQKISESNFSKYLEKIQKLVGDKKAKIQPLNEYRIAKLTNDETTESLHDKCSVGKIILEDSQLQKAIKNFGKAQDQVSATFLIGIQKKLIDSYLPFAVIRILKETGIITATDIISSVKKRFDIQLSPGTVYPVLYKLERAGNIERLPNRKKKIYALTKKGNNLLSQEIAEMLIQLDMLLSYPDLDIHACLFEIRKHSQSFY